MADKYLAVGNKGTAQELITDSRDPTPNPVTGEHPFMSWTLGKDQYGRDMYTGTSSNGTVYYIVVDEVPPVPKKFIVASSPP